jgi:hypothetical protein
MASAQGFAPHARATARAAVGRPIRRASSAYEIVSPAGTRRSAIHTRCWNAVPRTSSGSPAASAGCSTSEISGLELGVREATAHLGEKAAVVVPERDHAHATVGHRDDDPADRRRCERVGHGLPGGAAPEDGGRHAEQGPAVLVDATQGAEAGVVDGVRHVRSVRERVPEALRATGVRVAVRRQAGGGREGAAKGRRAHVRTARESAQRRGLGAAIDGIVDQARGRRDGIDTHRLSRDHRSSLPSAVRECTLVAGDPSIRMVPRLPIVGV